MYGRLVLSKIYSIQTFLYYCIDDSEDKNLGAITFLFFPFLFFFTYFAGVHIFRFGITPVTQSINTTIIWETSLSKYHQGERWPSNSSWCQTQTAVSVAILLCLIRASIPVRTFLQTKYTVEIADLFKSSIATVVSYFGFFVWIEHCSSRFMTASGCLLPNPYDWFVSRCF